MDWSYICAISYINCYYWDSQIFICSLWSTVYSGDRQHAILCWQRNGIIPQRQWHKAPNISTIPPAIKWPHWKSCIAQLTEGTLNSHLPGVLFSCRISHHSSTSVSPAELLLQYQHYTLLNLLFPSQVEHSQLYQNILTMLRPKIENLRWDNMCMPKTSESGYQAT